MRVTISTKSNENRSRNTKTKKKTVMLLAMIMFLTIVSNSPLFCFYVWNVVFHDASCQSSRSFDFHNKKAFPESQ